jgi:hypothetical protein
MGDPMKQSNRPMVAFNAAFLLLAALFAIPVPDAWADIFEEDGTDVEVACMRMDRSGNGYQLVDVGHITIFNDQQAAQNCNRAIYSCFNRCAACVYDYQYEDEVCEDRKGNRFLK